MAHGVFTGTCNICCKLGHRSFECNDKEKALSNDNRKLDSSTARQARHSLGIDDGATMASSVTSSHEVHMTHQLELILSTDVAVGETLKVKAAAGAGSERARGR